MVISAKTTATNKPGGSGNALGVPNGSLKLEKKINVNERLVHVGAV